MQIVNAGYGFDPTPAQDMMNGAIQNGLQRRQQTADIGMQLDAARANQERTRQAVLDETLRTERRDRALALIDAAKKSSGSLAAFQGAFKAGGAGENDSTWAQTRDAFMRGVTAYGYSPEEAQGMYRIWLNELGMQMAVGDGAAGSGGGSPTLTPKPTPQPTPTPVAPTAPVSGSRAPAQVTTGPFKAGQQGYWRMFAVDGQTPYFGEITDGDKQGYLPSALPESYAIKMNQAYAAYVQAMNAFAQDPQAAARVLGIPGTVVSPAMVAQAINTKYGVNIDYAKLGPAQGMTPAPPPAASGGGVITDFRGKRVVEGTGAYAQGKAPGQPQRPLSAVGLAMYEASSGDTHRPALVGDQEGIVNARAMASGGADIVRQLNELFPAAGGPSQTPVQTSYAGGYAPQPLPASVSQTPAGPQTPAYQPPAPQAPASTPLPAVGPADGAGQAPQAPDRETVVGRLLAHGQEELGAKIPPKPLTTPEARKWAAAAQDAAAAYDALKQGTADPKAIEAVFQTAQTAIRDGRVQRLSNESASWAARVLKGATPEELAFLGGQFADASQARLSRQNLQDELANRLKIAQMQIDAQNGGAASPLTYAFEMAKMILGDSVGKMDAQSILKKRAGDSLYNKAYNVLQRMVGANPTDVKKSWFWGPYVENTSTSTGLDPFFAVADKGQGVQGAPGAQPQAPQDPRAFLAQSGAVRQQPKP